jgi:hypothetical protein
MFFLRAGGVQLIGSESSVIVTDGSVRREASFCHPVIECKARRLRVLEDLSFPSDVVFRGGGGRPNQGR